MRRRTLGDDEPEGGGAGLRDLLDSIPDIEDPAPARPTRPARPTGPRRDMLGRPPGGSPEVTGGTGEDPGDRGASGGVADEDDEVFDDGTAEVRHERPARPTPWRRITFVVVLLSLFASIPVLANEGRLLVWGSKAGRDATRDVGREDPNYVEEVQATPTALIAQTDGEGRLLALTLLSLGTDTGGTVLFIPIRSHLPEVQYGLRHIEQKYDALDRSISSIGLMVGDVIGVGIDEVDAVDDRGYQQLFAPVGSITINNPDPMELSTGRALEVGEVTLSPAEVGPYLAHVGEGESQLSQYARHQLVWQAWLKAVAEAPEERAPSGGASGLGRFIAHLARASAANELQLTNLPGAIDDMTLFQPDETALEALMIDAVPVPLANRPGSRTTIQILNGVQPGPPPPDLVRAIVAQGASITLVGNGPAFGTDRTRIIYSDPTHEAAAREMAGELGLGDVEPTLDVSLAERADITLVFGEDLLAVLGSSPRTGEP